MLCSWTNRAPNGDFFFLSSFRCCHMSNTAADTAEVFYRSHSVRFGFFFVSFLVVRVSFVSENFDRMIKIRVTTEFIFNFYAIFLFPARNDEDLKITTQLQHKTIEEKSKSRQSERGESEWREKAIVRKINCSEK